MKSIFLFLCVSAFIGCQNLSEKADQSEESSLGYSIIEKEYYKIISLHTPFANTEVVERYLLYPKDSLPPKEENITHYIPTPLEKVAISSTTHLGYIQALNKQATIVAAKNLELFYNSEFKKRIEDGKVRDLGGRELNREALIDSKVEVLFALAIDGSSYNEIQHLRELGQKVILVSEYMEKTPLNKSSWLEVFASFYDEETQDKAKESLLLIEKRYLSIVQKAQTTSVKPTVMIGFPWKGSWYVTGGKSFQASYFRDANVDYVWSHLEQEGGIPLTVERVISDALDADFWLNCGAKQSYKEIRDADETLTSFKSYQQQAIYTNFGRSNELGANDYWESAVVYPDLVLADLVSIFHPQLKLDHQMTYYKKLDIE